MSRKSPKNYFIPSPYYRPCMYALDLFRKGGYDLGTAINISYNSFADPKASDRISEPFTRKKMQTYILDWLRYNSDYRRFGL